MISYEPERFQMIVVRVEKLSARWRMAGRKQGALCFFLALIWHS